MTKRKTVFMELIYIPWVTINITEHFFAFFFYVFGIIFEVKSAVNEMRYIYNLKR